MTNPLTDQPTAGEYHLVLAALDHMLTRNVEHWNAAVTRIGHNGVGPGTPEQVRDGAEADAFCQAYSLVLEQLYALTAGRYGHSDGDLGDLPAPLVTMPEVQDVVGALNAQGIGVHFDADRRAVRFGAAAGLIEISGGDTAWIVRLVDKGEIAAEVVEDLPVHTLLGRLLDAIDKVQGKARLNVPTGHVITYPHPEVGPVPATHWARHNDGGWSAVLEGEYETWWEGGDFPRPPASQDHTWWLPIGTTPPTGRLSYETAAADEAERNRRAFIRLLTEARAFALNRDGKARGQLRMLVDRLRHDYDAGGICVEVDPNNLLYPMLDTLERALADTADVADMVAAVQAAEQVADAMVANAIHVTYEDGQDDYLPLVCALTKHLTSPPCQVHSAAGPRPATVVASTLDGFVDDARRVQDSARSRAETWGGLAHQVQDLAAIVAQLAERCAWLERQHTQAVAQGLIARKKNPGDCTADESAWIKSYFDEFHPESTPEGREMADTYPAEKDDWWGEVEQGHRTAPAAR